MFYLTLNISVFYCPSIFIICHSILVLIYLFYVILCDNNNSFVISYKMQIYNYTLIGNRLWNSIKI